MTIDREQLSEIKAYMDERAEAWRMQSAEAARATARDEVHAADGRIAKRNTIFGVGVGVVLLSVAGFSYQAITSGVEVSAKQIATEVAEKVANDQLADGGRLLDLQKDLIDKVIAQSGGVAVAAAQADRASVAATQIAADVEQLQTRLETLIEGAAQAAETADAQSSALSEQIDNSDGLREELQAALVSARAVKQSFEEEAIAFQDARTQLDTAQRLLSELIEGENPIAETAQQLIEFALADREIQQLIVDAAAFPPGAVVAFANGTCPAGWGPYEAATGRFLLGTSEKYPPDAVGGAEAVTLTIAQMPAHSHSVTVPTVHLIGKNEGIATAGRKKSTRYNTSRQGSGKPHNNMPPFVAVSYCVKA